MGASLLIVGEAPSGHGRPLRGRIGRRLASLAGLSEEEFFDAVLAVNLLAAQPMQDRGKGRTFDAEAAERQARRIAARWEGRTLLLGKRVQRAFGCRRPEDVWADGRFAGMPHPSGIVRWWNAPANVNRAGALLRLLLRRGEQKTPAEGAGVKG